MCNKPRSVTVTKSQSDKVLDRPRRVKFIVVYSTDIATRRRMVRKTIRVSSIQEGRGRGGDMSSSR